MAKTLLNGVNDILTKVSALDSGQYLNSLTDTSRQTFIDIAKQSLNEVVDELYTITNLPMPKQLRESTLTLVASQRSYKLRSDAIRIRPEFGLIDETNDHVIGVMDEDGYRQIIVGDLGQDDTGLPSFCAQSPVDARLIMDRLPDSNAAGRVYKYRYEKDLEFDDKDDEMPFSDAVYRAVIPAAAEIWRWHRHQDFSEALYQSSLGRAARLLSRVPPRQTYMPASRGHNKTDPMND